MKQLRSVLLIGLCALILSTCHHPRYAHRGHPPPVHTTVIIHKPPLAKVLVRSAAPSIHHVWIWWPMDMERALDMDGYYKRRPYAHAHRVSGR